MSHRITSRAPRRTEAPRIEYDTSIVSSFLSDAAHVPGGHAAGVAFPATEAEVATLMAGATRILPVGAQSSLTGGATPRGEVVLSTRALTAIDVTGAAVRAGAGVPLSRLQEALSTSRLYYPPVPTYDGAFVGGTVSTNAAGAATFKYGATRAWVSALTVVLPNGEVLELSRGAVTACDGVFEIQSSTGALTRVPVPRYRMPDVPKLSAGYYAHADMDLIDLFIGSEGTLGVVVDATLRVMPRPRRSLALIECSGERQAVAVTAALRRAARETWAGRGPLDVAAIEYMDARALRVVRTDAFARAGIDRPAGDSVLLLVHIEITNRDDDAPLSALQAILTACGVARDPIATVPDDERSARRLCELREAVPTAVNAIVAAAKQSAHPDIEKTAGDMIVPFDRLSDSIALYRDAFERRRLDYAIWGHVSDGNLHANVLPRCLDDVERGREAIFEMARGVIAMGGAPLAEHGVGRSALKQRLLVELYGEDGIEQMRAVKRALDPEWKLSPGVLFSRDRQR